MTSSGKARHAGGDLDAHGPGRRRRVHAVLPVPVRRRAEGARDPVERDVGQQQVAGEDRLDVAAAVAPGPELLDDPRQLAHRRVVQRVGERLRTGALDGRVAALLDGPGGRVGQPAVLLGRALGAGAGDPERQREVDPGDGVGVAVAQAGGDERAAVAAVGHEAVVAQDVDDEVAEHVGGLVGAEAGAGRDRREPVPRQRRHDHLDGVGGVAAVRAGIGECRRQLEHLAVGAGPAVQQEERRPRRVAADRGEPGDVHVELADPRPPARQHGVEPGLLRPPVEPAGPVPGEVAQVGAVDAQLPGDVGRLVRPGRPLDPLDQVVEDGLLDVDHERLDSHRRAP